MIDDKKAEVRNNEFRKSLVKTKEMSESYVVLSMYKNTELYHDNNLTVNDFSSRVWKFYYALLERAIKDKKKVVDDIVLGMIVADSKELTEIYESYGSYNTIKQGMSFVEVENCSSYIADVKKYNALIRLYDLGYPIEDKFTAYKVMSAEAIQQSLDGALQSVFADIEIDEVVEDLKSDLWKVVIDAHEGVHRGFPYSSSMLNKIANGMPLGNITMLSAGSGIGKTFLAIAQIIPNMIKFNEKLLIIANEEDSSKWKMAIITWVANNVIENGNFNKQRFNEGNFTTEEFNLLKKATDWMKEKMEDGTIKFINLNSFNMKKTLKIMKKENALYDTKYFIIDTLKMDSDALNQNTQAWLSLMANMVELYNLVKPSNKNLFAFVTYQLGKSALLNKYLSQNDLGNSKSVVDVVSSLFLIRKALPSEKEGGKNPVKVKTPKGTREMKKDREYFILFLGKNRFGRTDKQIVLEVDIARNIVKDFGLCLIEQDW